MDALVTAGGIPTPDDPLYQYSLGKPKAMIEMAGKPMIQWVLDALGSATQVDNVILVGLDESSKVNCSKPLHFIANQGEMIDNIKIGTQKVLEINPKAKLLLAVSSDIPTITADMVDWAIENCQKGDYALYYNVVERSVMEKRFPGANRSYLKLKDIQVCGGDMNAFALWTVSAKKNLWDKLAASRKSVLKQAALIGYDTLLLVYFRLIGLDQAAAKFSKKIKIPSRAVLCPFAEIAMDVDKPHQFQLVRDDLERKSTK